MRPWQSMKIAFAMYSKIPMPHTEWTDKNLAYAFCFFPLVGLPIGGLLALWGALSLWFPVNPVLFAAVACVLPILVTGGIHLDGFCDTVDALSSRQPRERKLEILKDPHTGAFAILWCIVYFLLTFGCWSQLHRAKTALLVLGIAFVLSRAISSFAVVTLRPAKESGMLKTFTDATQKRAVQVTSLLLSLACAAGMAGLDWKLALAGLAGAGLSFLYYRRMAYRQFGGITGDLAGYYLQVCELSMLLCVTAAQIFFQKGW